MTVNTFGLLVLTNLNPFTSTLGNSGNWFIKYTVHLHDWLGVIKVLHLTENLVVKVTYWCIVFDNCNKQCRVLNWNALPGEGDGSDHCELDPLNADDQLSPVEKLEKFIDCKHSYSRYNNSHRLN